MQVERRVGVAPLRDGERALRPRPGRWPPRTRRGSRRARGSSGRRARSGDAPPRAAAIGALKAPIDWATSTTSRRSPIARGDRVGVLGEAGAVLPGGEVDRDGLVSGVAQQRQDEVPVEGVAARARHEDECRGSCPYNSAAVTDSSLG